MSRLGWDSPFSGLQDAPLVVPTTRVRLHYRKHESRQDGPLGRLLSALMLSSDGHSPSVHVHSLCVQRYLPMIGRKSVTVFFGQYSRTVMMAFFKAAWQGQPGSAGM